MSEFGIFLFPPSGLPGKTRFGGYVYIVEFDSGLLKVGMTQFPQSRLTYHARHAASFGIRAVRGWLSPLHEEPFRTEGLLIAAAAEMGTAAGGREYFAGVGFEEIVTRAAAFDFPAVDFAAAEAEEEYRRKHPIFGNVTFVQDAAGNGATAPVKWPSTAVAEIFARRGDVYHVPTLHREPFPDDLIQRVSDASGMDVEEVLDMNYIDLIEQTGLTTVRAEAMQMREYAYRASRTDMLLPMREARVDLNATEPDDA